MPHTFVNAGGPGARFNAMTITAEQALQIEKTVVEAGQFMLMHYGCVVDLIESYMIDVKDRMKEKSKAEFRFTKKHYYTRSFTAIQAVTSRMLNAAKKKGNTDLLVDSFDTIMQDVKPQQLYWPLVNYLSKMGISNAQYKAHFEVINVLLNFAHFVLKEISNTLVRETNVRFVVHEFDDYSADDSWIWWGKLCDEVLDYGAELREPMYQSEDISRWIDILRDRVLSEYWIGQAYEEIAEAHPDKVKSGVIIKE